MQGNRMNRFGTTLVIILCSAAAVVFVALGCSTDTQGPSNARPTPCRNECESGEFKCVGEGASSACSNTDTDECLEWTTPIRCAPNAPCRDTGPLPGQCTCTGECTPGDTRPEPEGCLGSAVGLCRKGHRVNTCSKNCTWIRGIRCEGQVGPAPEECNGLDDNCDALLDNAPGSTAPLTRVCQTTGTGGNTGCGPSIQTCTRGQWGPCIVQQEAGQPIVRTKEDLCDGIDDDCDGKVDGDDPDLLPRDCNARCGAGKGSAWTGSFGRTSASWKRSGT